MYCWNPTTGEHAYLDWVPFRTRDGRTLMYCWNPTTGEHAYLDCESDMILSTEEAEMALGRLEKE
jgi:hypothetical protein